MSIWQANEQYKRSHLIHIKKEVTVNESHTIGQNLRGTCFMGYTKILINLRTKNYIIKRMASLKGINKLQSWYLS